MQNILYFAYKCVRERHHKPNNQRSNFGSTKLFSSTVDNNTRRRISREIWLSHKMTIRPLITIITSLSSIIPRLSTNIYSESSYFVEIMTEAWFWLLPFSKTVSLSPANRAYALSGLIHCCRHFCSWEESYMHMDTILEKVYWNNKCIRIARCHPIIIL